MDGKWIKVVLFVLGAMMLAGVVTVLLDQGLGEPDDVRRTRHIAGFSISYPIGWGGSAFGQTVDSPGGTIRTAPERKTGRETAISVTGYGNRPPKMSDAKPGTFQGQPAFLWSGPVKRDWLWRVWFERDGKWFQIALAAPLELDVEKSGYWPYINSFRIEKTIDPASHPTTSAAGEPLIVPVD